MKLPIIAFAAAAAILLPPVIAAEDPPAGCTCEMMKKHAATAAENTRSDAQVDRAELDKLVAEMNGSMGPKKIEAMAAVLNRLVEQSRARAVPAAPKPAENEAPKSEAHQH